MTFFENMRIFLRLAILVSALLFALPLITYCLHAAQEADNYSDETMQLLINGAPAEPEEKQDALPEDLRMSALKNGRKGGNGRTAHGIMRLPAQQPPKSTLHTLILVFAGVVCFGVVISGFVILLFVIEQAFLLREEESRGYHEWCSEASSSSRRYYDQQPTNADDLLSMV